MRVCVVCMVYVGFAHAHVIYLRVAEEMVPIICVLNHERISWVSIEIYYHDNFVFGHIFMFLTSIFAHFCVLCTYLVSKQQEAYGESNHGMLFICWPMLWS